MKSAGLRLENEILHYMPTINLPLIYITMLMLLAQDDDVVMTEGMQLMDRIWDDIFSLISTHCLCNYAIMMVVMGLNCYGIDLITC